MTEENKQAEEAKDEQKQRPELTPKEVLDTLSEGGGKLANLLDEILETPLPVPDEVFSTITARLGNVGGKVDCPCGRVDKDGKQVEYRNCCRPRFQMLERARRERREKEGVANEPEGMQWLIKVGVDKRGFIDIKPVDASRAPSPDVAVDLLMKAWSEMFKRTVAMSARNEVIAMMSRKPKGRMHV